MPKKLGTQLKRCLDPAYVDCKGAGHGFMRAGEAPDASEANKQARADAWKRLETILAPLK